MLTEGDHRDPSDATAVLAAILAAREVYPDEEFQIWADAWIGGRDREGATAETAEASIRTAWSLPNPYGDDWKQRILEMIFSGATHDELCAETLKASEAAGQIELPTPADQKAEATMFAVTSALSATMAAQAYAAEAYIALKYDAQIREHLKACVDWARSFAADCQRLRRSGPR